SLKTVECLWFTFVNIEHCKKLGYSEKVLKFLRKIEQFQLSVFFIDGRITRHQLSNTARIDIPHSREVQKNALLAFFQQPANSSAKSYTTFTNRNLSTHIKNGHISCLTFRDIQLSHFQRSPFCNCD